MGLLAEVILHFGIQVVLKLQRQPRSDFPLLSDVVIKQAYFSSRVRIFSLSLLSLSFFQCLLSFVSWTWEAVAIYLQNKVSPWSSIFLWCLASSQFTFGSLNHFLTSLSISIASLLSWTALLEELRRNCTNLLHYSKQLEHCAGFFPCILHTRIQKCRILFIQSQLIV